MSDLRDLHTLRDLHDLHALPASAACPAPVEEVFLTVGEAAAFLTVTPSTVRRWAASGKLEAKRVRGPNGPELRLDAGSVAALRLVEEAAATASERPARETQGTHAGHAGHAGVDADKNFVNADLCSRLAEVERERDEVRIQVLWLRGQVEEARRGESELRVLLLEQARALQSLTLPAALPPAPARPWWRFW